MCVSTQVTLPALSEVVGMPGKGTRTSRSRKAFPVRGVAPWTTVLIVALPKKSDLETYENFWATQIYEDSVSDSAAHGKGHAETSCLERNCARIRRRVACRPLVERMVSRRRSISLFLA